MSRSRPPSSRPGRASSRPSIDPDQSIAPGDVRKRVLLAKLSAALFALLLIATFVRNCIYGFGSAPFESAPAPKDAPQAPAAPR